MFRLVQDRQDPLTVESIYATTQPLIAEGMTGLRKLDLPGFDPVQAKQFLGAVSKAVAQGELGYVLLLAAKSKNTDAADR